MSIHRKHTNTSLLKRNRVILTEQILVQQSNHIKSAGQHLEINLQNTGVEDIFIIPHYL